MPSVTVTAEWALWGKWTGGTDYQLLECSAGGGRLSSENFDHLITRYSPGTLESLPQVTISWLSDSKSQANYLAIAIHHRMIAAEPAPGRPGSRLRAAAPAAYDAHGRVAVGTSYYCVPFHDVAAHGVSYPAMFEAFRQIRLPASPGQPVTVTLAAGPGSTDVAPPDDALRIAALLLTGKPVCVLGATHLDVAERLAFLDTVASLLPYGIRTRLSASTWTSSTYQTHRFRAFFASEARNNHDDHVIIWNQARTAAIRDEAARAYLDWLSIDPRQRITQLAADQWPMNFTRSDVQLMLARLGVSGPETETRPLPGPPLPQPARKGREMTVAELLVYCGERLDAGEPELEIDIAELEPRLAQDRTDAERQDYQDIIRDRDLLREDLQVQANVRAQFYDVLLGLAFPGPLSYADYCRIEECAHIREGQVPHLSLLEALRQRKVDDELMRPLLQLLREGDPSARPARRLTAAELVALADQPRLQPGHARLAYDALAAHPEAGSKALRTALREHGYLAATLEQQYPADRGFQVKLLHDLLGLAYGQRLDQRAIREILGSDPHVGTAALVAAILVSAERYGDIRPELTALLLGASAGRPAVPAGPGPAAPGPAAPRPAAPRPAASVLAAAASAAPLDRANRAMTAISARARSAARQPAHARDGRARRPATVPNDPQEFLASLRQQRRQRTRRFWRRFSIALAVLVVIAGVVLVVRAGL